MTTGKAYGFFDCDAPKARVMGEMPHIRSAVGTPDRLQLYLTEGMDPQGMGNRYEFEVRHPGASNRRAATEATIVLNQTYQSPAFRNGGPFTGEIVFEEKGERVYRE
ncbi:hypothetical protein ACFLQN_00610 [Candidatus Aenigmatarchaeota archaeon]